MESDELVEIEGSYDHLYWGMATNINPFNLQLDSYYECNEDNCGPDGQEGNVRWNRYWFTVERFVKIKREWEENGSAFMGFTVSGISRIMTTFDNQPVQIETGLDFKPLSPGSHVVSIMATDQAGWMTVFQYTFNLVATEPTLVCTNHQVTKTSRAITGDIMIFLPIIVKS